MSNALRQLEQQLRTALARYEGSSKVGLAQKDSICDQVDVLAAQVADTSSSETCDLLAKARIADALNDQRIAWSIVRDLLALDVPTISEFWQ